MAEEVLKVEKRVVVVEWEEQRYPLRPPTKRKIIKFAKEGKKIPKDDHEALFEHGCQMVIDAGLPEEVLDEMTVQEIEQIVSALQSQKKT